MWIERAKPLNHTSSRSNPGEYKPVEIEQVRTEVPPDNFEKFAEYHKLKLVVNESLGRERPVFQVQFSGAEDGKLVEVAERGMLRGEYGIGPTQREAIEDYKRNIAGKNLAVGSWGEDKGRRFWCPKEWK